MLVGTFNKAKDIKAPSLNIVFREIVLTPLCWHMPGSGNWSHLSPGVSLISDLAHDSGILQSELFTSRSQNPVLAKLPNSGFWRYSQIFK